MNNVDVLRALAVLAVFLHHVNHIYQLNVPFFGEFGGVFGVQLFFLISGFLIIKSAEKHTLRTYVLHRFFRIFPVYLVTFFGIGVLIGVINFATVMDNPWGLIVNMLSLQQLFPKQLIIYDVLHVSWTLTVELVWYFLAPLMLFAFKRNLVTTVIVSMLISTVWVYFASLGKLDFIYAQQLSEINESVVTHRSLFINNAFIPLMCFFIIGAYIHYKEAKLVALSPAVLVFIFLTCSLLYPYWQPQELNPSVITGLGLAALFILALRLPKVEFKPIKYLADISYSFYLTHLTVLIVLHHAMGLTSKWFALPAFCITLGVSFLLYKFIEKPMMAYARKLSLS